MASDTSTVHEGGITKPVVEAPSKQQQQQPHSRPTSQSAEEWLKKLDDLEAQCKGSTQNTSKWVDPAQVDYKQLTPQLRDGMDHEDLLDALERGEL